LSAFVAISFRVADDVTAESHTSQFDLAAWIPLDRSQPGGLPFLAWIFRDYLDIGTYLLLVKFLADLRQNRLENDGKRVQRLTSARFTNLCEVFETRGYAMTDLEQILEECLDAIKSGAEADLSLREGDVVDVVSSNSKLIAYGFYRFFTTVVNVGASANVPIR